MTHYTFLAPNCLVADTPLVDLDPAAAQRRMEEALRANAARPLFTGTAVSRNRI